MTRLLPFGSLLLTALTSCVEPPKAPSDTGEATPTGQIAIRMSIDPDLVDVMNEPAWGVFYGQIFNAEEVDALGPKAGATELDSIEHELNLDDGVEASDIFHTSVPLAVEEVVVLGFLDSDENADESDMGPDGGDPVTLPAQNSFDVTFGAVSAVTVELGMLYPE